MSLYEALETAKLIALAARETKARRINRLVSRSYPHSWKGKTAEG